MLSAKVTLGSWDGGFLEIYVIPCWDRWRGQKKAVLAREARELYSRPTPGILSAHFPASETEQLDSELERSRITRPGAVQLAVRKLRSAAQVGSA